MIDRLVGEFDLLLELQDREGKILDRCRVEERDLARLLEDALFSAVCAGRVPNLPEVMAGAAARIVPRFSEGEKARGPAIDQVEVGITYHPPEGAAIEFSKVYRPSCFKIPARGLLSSFLNRRGASRPEMNGVEENSEPLDLRFGLSAFRRNDPTADPGMEGGYERADRAKGGLNARIVPERPFPFMERPFSDFRLLPSHSVGDLPIFIEENVIEETIAQTIEAGGMEQASFLIGQLCRDPKGPAYMVITAQIPAKEGVVAKEHSVTFSHEAFLAARGITSLRRRGEIVLGWAHNHHWCGSCPGNPSGSTIFFSSADVDVHASAFPRPFQVALVAGRDLALDAARPAVRLYGWKEGDLAERSYLTFKGTNRMEAKRWPG